MHNSTSRQPPIRCREPSGEVLAVEDRGQWSRRWEGLVGEEDWRAIGEELALSARELQVVRGLFAGLKLGAIASRLGLGLGTIKTYVQRIYRKLEVRDQRELFLAIGQLHMSRQSLVAGSTR